MSSPNPPSSPELSASPRPKQLLIQQIPPPTSTPASAPHVGSPRGNRLYLPTGTRGNDTPGTTSATEELNDAQKAEIIRRHLLTSSEQEAVSAQSADPAGGQLSFPATESVPRNAASWAQSSSSASGSTPPPESTIHYPTPYGTQGGDIVAPIYKWAQQQQQTQGAIGLSSSPGGFASGAQTPSLRRSKSLLSVDELASRRPSHSTDRPDLSITFQNAGESEMSAREILEPGGFRRDFLIRRQQAMGYPAQTPATRSFVDFLSLYGHFGGEDLEEIDEEEEDDDEEEEEEEDNVGFPRSYGAIPRARLVQPSENNNETAPLIRSRTASRPGFTRQGTGLLSQPSGLHQRKRAMSAGEQTGDATVTQAVLMLLKSFVGTGVLFLGKAFANGGLIFSTIVLCSIAMISLFSFLLLVETRLKVKGSYGDIGGILYGPHMRAAILFSIVTSQMGFVAAYTVFVAQNLQGFFMAVSNCSKMISIPRLIFGEFLVFLPFAMIRNIHKLSTTALVADAFILFGLVYIFGNEISILLSRGMGPNVIKYVNPKEMGLMIGTAVFSFEGIGLVIPITESMKQPHKFPGVLTGVMVGVMILFAGAGALAYSAYGDQIQTVVFLNLPQDDKFVNASQLLYSLAILLSTPLQLFPAVRIMENGLFSSSGKHSTRIKWQKNGFRAASVAVCCLVACFGAADLDKFVSLIGSVACIPLCFCYPAMLHYKGVAQTRKQKAGDIALFLFGLAALFYSATETINLLTSGASAPPKSPYTCPPKV